MIRSNIDGLGSLLRKFDDRIKELERKTLQGIDGGENVRVSYSRNRAIINANPAGDGGAVVSATSCDFVFQKFDIQTPEPVADEEVDSTFKIRATGGTVNGLLPSNYDEIGDFSTGSDAFVSLLATADQTGITTLQYKIESTPPAISPQYEEGAPPSEVSMFAFMVTNGSIKSSLCRSLIMTPEVAYLDQSTSPYKNICTWNISNVT